MNTVWEEVESGMNRAPVPGGWIVRHYDPRFDERLGRRDWQLVSAFFVPDETHAWDITADASVEGRKPAQKGEA